MMPIIRRKITDERYFVSYESAESSVITIYIAKDCGAIGPIAHFLDFKFQLFSILWSILQQA